ncbi:uncharacterized protein A4U43_UnF12050 [Asparagus officinalis]|uniref:RING-type domain-containing protein n=1 Tax=Asparagus officinalis TaxID=4686 RepID=A0A1R3L560_ASPOF|nr:putative RING-H2 finger protein ATL69 [Asparagus officinalis]ONK54744.1 uncharacterized protein A4U43_UnF12050 [Asparagus officinalis]
MVSMAMAETVIFDIWLALTFIHFMMFIKLFIEHYIQRHNSAATDHIPLAAAAAASVFVVIDVAPHINPAAAGAGAAVMFVMLAAFINLTEKCIKIVQRHALVVIDVDDHHDSVVTDVERLLKMEEIGWVSVGVEDVEGDQSKSSCAICLQEYNVKEKVRVLPNCSHRFHIKCIDQWLVMHSSCPLCRGQIWVLQY